ncbi:hypothetical protein Tco_1044520 [Tanacetum coccineum]|uniref:Uncharacterized protein n=1 Tax=Tanacetum coccineum TaxID=301880 RepID=A0ABQ5GQ59_9ASTR
MVAYLEKSDENAEFHQIVDFLSTCSINYALTDSDHREQLPNDCTFSGEMDTSGSPRCQRGAGARGYRVGVRAVYDIFKLGGQSEGRADTFELMDTIPPTPHDSPLTGGYTPGSDEGRLKLDELITLCTKLSKQVLDLEKEKDAQAMEILKLKKRVKKLERKRKLSISHPKRRIYRQDESFNDDLDEEDASKQGRTGDKTKPMFQDSDFDELDDDIC